MMEEKSSITKEVVEPKLKNVHEEIGCNKGNSLTFSESSFIKVEKSEVPDNDLAVLLIKEYNDPEDDVFRANKTSPCSIIKKEQERHAFDIEHSLSNANNDVKCTLDPLADLDKFDYEIKIEDWKLKYEKVDTKEEDLEQTDIRMLPNSIYQKEHNECIMENVYQKLQQRNLEKPEKVNMFKCDQCDYQTSRKDVFKIHLLRHQNLEDVEQFKCDQCDYQTPYKRSIKMHLIRHKNPEEVKKFKCNQCDYQTFHKGSLKKHLIRHKNPEDVEKFKCNQCGYQTPRIDVLKRHLLQHKNPEDIVRFKCEHCNYQTLQKVTLMRHLLRHTNPKDVEKFKCNQCDYQTFRKDTLKRHLFRHKNPVVRS